MVILFHFKKRGSIVSYEKFSVFVLKVCLYVTRVQVLHKLSNHSSVRSIKPRNYSPIRSTVSIKFPSTFFDYVDIGHTLLTTYSNDSIYVLIHG